MKQFLSLRTTTRVNHIAHSPLNVYSATAHGKENKIKAQLSAHCRRNAICDNSPRLHGISVTLKECTQL